MRDRGRTGTSIFWDPNHGFQGRVPSPNTPKQPAAVAVHESIATSTQARIEPKHDFPAASVVRRQRRGSVRARRRSRSWIRNPEEVQPRPGRITPAVGRDAAGGRISLCLGLRPPSLSSPARRRSSFIGAPSRSDATPRAAQTLPPPSTRHPAPRTKAPRATGPAGPGPGRGRPSDRSGGDTAAPNNARTRPDHRAVRVNSGCLRSVPAVKSGGGGETP